jgi:hypothetical protein
MDVHGAALVIGRMGCDELGAEGAAVEIGAFIAPSTCR